jgi:hypothetical protein
MPFIMRCAAVIVLAAVLQACASSGGTGRTAGIRTQVVQSEIATSGTTDALQLLERVRPEWLRVRNLPTGRPSTVLVYLDNTRFGELASLRDIATETIGMVEYVSGGAQQQYVLGNEAATVSAVILVYSPALAERRLAQQADQAAGRQARDAHLGPVRVHLVPFAGSTFQAVRSAPPERLTTEWNVADAGNASYTPMAVLQVPLMTRTSMEVFGSRSFSAQSERWVLASPSGHPVYNRGVNYERTGMAMGFMLSHQTRVTRLGAGLSWESANVQFSVGECRCEEEKSLKTQAAGPVLAAAIRVPAPLPGAYELRLQLQQLVGNEAEAPYSGVPWYSPNRRALFLGVGAALPLFNP